jgi:hypothetical protein
MDQILAGDTRDIDWTIELTFPDATGFQICDVADDHFTRHIYQRS